MQTKRKIRVFDDGTRATTDLTRTLTRPRRETRERIHRIRVIVEKREGSK
jgi:hypothetical protein